MSKILQSFNRPITIIGGGEFIPEVFNFSLQLGPDLIAVDGGLNYLNPKSHFPQWIIGDLDSVKNAESWIKIGTKLKHLPEQDSTDFDKCLYSIDAPLYLANGFLGNRVDHTLAACSTLVRRQDKNVILLGKKDLIVHLNKSIKLGLKVGTRLSLFPFKKVVGLKSFGLKYSITEIIFSPGSMIGTSNEVVSSEVEINIEGSGMLLILPIDCLSEVLDSYGVYADV